METRFDVIVEDLKIHIMQNTTIILRSGTIIRGEIDSVYNGIITLINARIEGTSFGTLIAFNICVEEVCAWSIESAGSMNSLKSLAGDAIK